MNLRQIAVKAANVPSWADDPDLVPYGRLFAALQDDPLPSVVCYAATGVHRVNGAAIGGGMVVEISRRSSEQFIELVNAAANRGWKWRLSVAHFDHDIPEATTAIVRAMWWDDSRGIMASVDWTEAGEYLLRGLHATEISVSFRYNEAEKTIREPELEHALGGLVATSAIEAAENVMSSFFVKAGLSDPKPRATETAITTSQSTRRGLVGIHGAVIKKEHYYGTSETVSR